MNMVGYSKVQVVEDLHKKREEVDNVDQIEDEGLFSIAKRCTVL